MNDKRIPIPWSIRWKQFRYSTLPMLGFLTFLALALFLWTSANDMPHAIGEIEAVRVNVSSNLAGMLRTVPGMEGKLYEKVEKDQVIALIDDKSLRGQLATLQQELARLGKELEAEKDKLVVSEADRVRSRFAESVPLYVELEQSRLEVLEHRLQMEVDRLEAQRTNTYYECIEPLFEKKMISEQELNNARSYRDEAAKRMEEDSKIVQEAEARQKNAEERLKKLSDILPADMAKRLSPFDAALDVQQSLIAEKTAEIERLTIRSPIAGMICAIHHLPNENVPAGEPIMTIAAEQGRYLVSFVRQEQHIDPKKGMTVDVRKRAAVSTSVQTNIECVGPQIEQIPQHLCRDPKIPEWGLPVRIAIPDKLPGHPGELFEITFKKES
jgi:multidrug resistance efflux pump